MDKKVNEVESILNQRQQTHGNFEDMAATSHILKVTLYDNKHPAVVAEAIDMIVHKLSRVKNGNCVERDHWVDIAGYATLVVKWIDKKEENTKCDSY